MKKFRLQSKYLFLTFPKVQKEYTLQEIIQKIKTREKHIVYILACIEKHQDGSIHYHIFIHYSQRKNVTNARYFDYIFDTHGDYQKARNIKYSINYIKKHGKYIEGGKAPINIQHDILKEVLSEVKEGHLDTHTIMKENRLDITTLFNKINQIDRFERKAKQIKFEEILRAKQSIQDIQLEGLQDELLAILSFIKYNLKDRAYKSPMLHIGSKEPNTGKTSLTNILYELSPCYLGPDDTGFQDYKNNLYQFIIGDEFNLHGWQIPFLNRFFAGNRMSLPMKGSHAYKSDNPLIIMTSNQPLHIHIEHKFKFTNKRFQETAFKTLIARIHEIEIQKPLFKCYNLGKEKMSKHILRQKPRLSPQ